jgi:hypothetical protein
MKTVIAEDRVRRFSELDHAVLEEVRAIVETGAADEPHAGTKLRTLQRLLTTLRASIRLSRPS